MTSENREKNNFRVIARAIWSLDEVTRKILRGCTILEGYESTNLTDNCFTKNQCCDSKFQSIEREMLWHDDAVEK